MSEYKYVGHSRPLDDGPAKVTGQQKYLGDLQLNGMLHARLVTSPFAHANIVSVDKSMALDADGVVAVLTSEDLPDIKPDARNKLMLARGRVVFAGQPVALVLGETAAAAEDGVDLVFVDYDPQPVFVSMRDALKPDAPLVWRGGSPGETDEAAAHGADVGGEADDEVPSNRAGKSGFQRGDVEAGFADADLIVERRFTTSIVHQSYLEPHSVVVQPDAFTGGATVWTSTQAPFYARQEVARVLGVAESDVRVVPTLPGGAFGAKFLLNEPMIALVAQKMNRPIRFIMTRSEDMLATNPAPASEMTVKLGLKKDGTFTALDADILFDVGCFPASHGISALLMGSTYQVANMDLRYTEVMSFKLSSAAYRAPGTPQAYYALESVIDEAARKLGIDQVAIRRQNVSNQGDPMATGDPWPKIGVQEVLNAVEAHPVWQQREQLKAEGKGVGLALGSWPGGIEPTAASAQLHRDGTLHIHIGSVDLTGTPTTFALMAAETFGVEPGNVRVITGDTSQAAYAGATGGSKITYMVGSSVIKAAKEARKQTLEIVAEELEAAVEDLEIANGMVQVKGVPDKSVSLNEIASKTMRFGGAYPPIAGYGRHAESNRSPGFCAQIAVLDIDETTGEVRVEKLVAIQDVGKAINPMVVEGQIHGGTMQGLGFALHERMAHDGEGQNITGTWLDYNFPQVDQVAEKIETVLIEVPSDFGPFGAKGIGEPPIIATAAAVGNAIFDHTGARVTDLPMTPPRILAAMVNGDH